MSIERIRVDDAIPIIKDKSKENELDNFKIYIHERANHGYLYGEYIINDTDNLKYIQERFQVVKQFSLFKKWYKISWEFSDSDIATNSRNTALQYNKDTTKELLTCLWKRINDGIKKGKDAFYYYFDACRHISPSIYKSIKKDIESYGYKITYTECGHTYRSCNMCLLNDSSLIRMQFVIKV